VKAHGQAVSVLRAFDRFLLSGSSDSSVKIWKVQRGDVNGIALSLFSTVIPANHSR